MDVPRPADPIIELRVTIHEDDLNQWVIKVMGEYTLDPVRGESPEAFSADHPPPTNGPLVGMVSHSSPVPTDEVIFCVPLFMLFLFIKLTRVCKQCSC